MKNVLFSALFVLASASSVMACTADEGSSDPTKDPAKTEQPAPTGTEQQTGAVTPAPTTAPTVADQAPPPAPKVDPPAAPKMDKIGATSVGIEMIWEAQQCDQFVGERKYGQLDYAEVFTLPGSTTEFIDTSVTGIPNNDTIKFTYRIMCKKTDVASDPSNELTSTGKVQLTRAALD